MIKGGDQSSGIKLGRKSYTKRSWKGNLTSSIGIKDQPGKRMHSRRGEEGVKKAVDETSLGPVRRRKGGGEPPSGYLSGKTSIPGICSHILGRAG